MLSTEGASTKGVRCPRPPPRSEVVLAEFLDFMARLMCGLSRRLGRLGTEEVKAHPWFAGVDWSALTAAEGPYVNEGMRRAGAATDALRTLPRSDPRFVEAVKSICVSFEEAKLADEASIAAESAASGAASSAASGAGGLATADKVVGYTYSRGSRDGAPAEPKKRESKASALLAKHKSSGKASAAAAAASGSPSD